MSISTVPNRGNVAPSLTAIGLSADADLVYRHLTTFGPHGVADLSQTLGLVSARARLALDELADVGAARAWDSASGSARKWIGTPRHLVADDVRARQRDAALQRHRLQRKLAGVTDLGLADAVAGGRLLSSITRVQVRIDELVAAERCEHLVMNPTPNFNLEAVDAAAGAHKSLLDNQIAVRELGVPPVSPDTTQLLHEEFTSAGAQFRQLPSVPTKFMVFDRTTALVRVDANDPSRGMLEIMDSTTVHALVELFERYWQRANDYRTGCGQVELTERERAIVRLLAAGVSDTDVAAQLGLSVRTIAYAMRDLLDKYGAKNRFQLGLALGPVLGPSVTSPDEIHNKSKE